jgi:hypothetical protein
LALEPLVLGMLVAPSLGGLALGTATVAAFFARRPLKTVFGPDTARRGTLAAAAVLSLCAGTGLAEAAAIGGVAALRPLLLCAPFLALFLYADWRGDPRAARSELAGSAAFAVLPAALSCQAGWPLRSALALAAVMAARSIPTVVAVRAAVRIRKNQPASRLAPAAASIAGLLLLAALAARSLAPWPVAGLACLLAARSVFIVAPREVPLSPRRLGSLEVVVGMLYVLGSAAVYRSWHP